MYLINTISITTTNTTCSSGLLIMYLTISYINKKSILYNNKKNIETLSDKVCLWLVADQWFSPHQTCLTVPSYISWKFDRCLDLGDNCIVF
jgi:hypothetical protein